MYIYIYIYIYDMYMSVLLVINTFLDSCKSARILFLTFRAKHYTPETM